MKTPEEKQATISVALSGGGHRASLFGLGALMYLADAGLNRHVTSIASVSGGSITNGFVAQNMDYRAVNGAEFERLVTPLAKRLANQGTLLSRMPSLRRLIVMALSLLAINGVWLWPETSRVLRFVTFSGLSFVWSLMFVPRLFGTPRSRTYGVWLASTLLALLPAPWVLPLSGIYGAPFARFLWFLGALLAWASLVAGRRGHICEGAYRDVFFNFGGEPTLLRDVEREIDHVFCATEIQRARQIYFSPRFVSLSTFGPGQPGELSLATAVGASACLPGAFPPRWLRTDALFAEARKRKLPKHLVLVDGGVYDNMADQWAQSLTARRSSLAKLAQHPPPQHLIVVNASGGWRLKAMKRTKIPAFGELAALLRDKSVMYDQTTALRRQGLVGRFGAALLARTGRKARQAAQDQPSVSSDLLGTLVHIPQAPYDVAEDFARGSGDFRNRAEAVLKAISDREGWRAIAKETTDVPTTLAALGQRQSARLLHHGYVLAMMNLHVVLDYPLLAVPNIERFEAMVEEEDA